VSVLVGVFIVVGYQVVPPAINKPDASPSPSRPSWGMLNAMEHYCTKTRREGLRVLSGEIRVGEPCIAVAVNLMEWVIRIHRDITDIRKELRTVRRAQRTKGLEENI